MENATEKVQAVNPEVFTKTLQNSKESSHITAIPQQSGLYGGVQ